jgi:lipoprotein-anchoring transpeptidase ErfK/SrfK
MADLSPGKIELHGTGRDELGNDVLPAMSGTDVTHGCVRATNNAIRRIKKFAPPGTEVQIIPYRL